MTDETKPPAHDPIQFAKPDERKHIDRERIKFLEAGGTIKKYPPAQMDNRGRRGPRPPAVECKYFRKGVGASETWYPGYVPRPDRRADYEKPE